jgi:pyruvate/2-oxoglutarate/acetoin dehydrogenase E1 component
VAQTERVAENLNRALAGLLDEDPRVHVLGEDVVDPYGGAFKVTRGLSTRHPDRVLSTPISEGAIVGVGGGLALAGETAIVEMMFSDFVTLAFDQIVNFASKSVAMYGRRVPMRLVVRCATGGNRQYGPTHSQSLQKHFVGVPGLGLYELSPFHDSRALLDRILASGEPALLFEDKVLYAQRTHRDGVVDDLFGFELVRETDPVARVFVDTSEDPDCVVIAPGGVCGRALAAARDLLLEDEIACQILVPSRLHPFDVEPLLGLLARARHVCIIEESTAGGTWGACIAHDLHRRLWGRLRAPVQLVHSADSVIPAAGHLEHSVLLQEADIRLAIRKALRRV